MNATLISKSHTTIIEEGNSVSCDRAYDLNSENGLLTRKFHTTSIEEGMETLSNSVS
jgi:hypothetical protein